MAKLSVSKQLQSLERNATQHPKNTPVRNGRGKISKLKLSLFIVTGLLFLLCVGFVLGINQWVVKYVECKEAPVIITSNLAGTNYKRLYVGDKDYLPHFFDSYIDYFDSYECMTPEEKTGL